MIARGIRDYGLGTGAVIP